MSKLYIVPTPIGNLEDMTMRAIKVLQEVDCILAEDTRTSGILMKHFDIKTRMQSHHKFNEHKTVEAVVERLRAGETIALVSDAGTPAISDPGFLLVRESRKAGIPVECLPGATACRFRIAVRPVYVRRFSSSEKRSGNSFGGIVD